MYTNKKDTLLSRKVINEFKLFWIWEIWKMMKSADVKILRIQFKGSRQSNLTVTRAAVFVLIYYT